MQSLDFLGYVGGIQAVLAGAIFKFCEFFSIAFLFANFSNSFLVLNSFH
jgi:hypothetical protein